ncbi:MAG: SRPBCC family protein [Ignavibacteriae bacterium]|nr:SRPBCC family protein [Ignavibacteriota bacterium]
MKIVKTLALIFAALVISFFLYSFFLPSDYTVNRKISIYSKNDIVFAYINNLHSWEDWSDWTVKQDSTLRIYYKGPVSGRGAIQLWNSNRMGKGSIEITKSITPNEVEYLMKIDKEDYISKGKFNLKQTFLGTEINWTIKGEVSWNPIAKIFSYFYMDKFMGPDLERGLKNLKKLIENRNQV